MIPPRFLRGRRFPAVRGWRARGLAFFVLTTTLSSLLPLLWLDWSRTHRLLDLEWLGLAPGAVVAFVVSEGFGYWWHRAQHHVGFLWRWTHQLHHSAERVDLAGAFVFHPFDTAATTAVTSLSALLVVGVSPSAAAIAGALASFYGVFQHANIVTPTWLGWIIQRPESHCVHHQRELHAYNYANLPLWDIVFSTFRNPPAWRGHAGFWDGASSLLGAMLAGVDVNERRPRDGKLSADP